MSGSALVQKERGEFVNANGFTAWQGFQERGFESSFFSWAEMADGLPVDAETIVVGSVASVRLALTRLGVDPPPIDYPTPLRDYLGRVLRESTLGEIRARWQEGGPPVFIKPRHADKCFGGHLVSAFRDLIRTSRLPREMPLWESGPVEFCSEWRYFVHRGEVVGVGHYKGDPLRQPDPEVVRSAIADFAPEAPIAYGIDFGPVPDGRTLLVEVNDGFALGCYGLKPIAYLRFLEDRWRELVRSPLPDR